MYVLCWLSEVALYMSVIFSLLSMCGLWSSVLGIISIMTSVANLTSCECEDLLNCYSKKSGY